MGSDLSLAQQRWLSSRETQVTPPIYILPLQSITNTEGNSTNCTHSQVPPDTTRIREASSPPTTRQQESEQHPLHQPPDTTRIRAASSPPTTRHNKNQSSILSTNHQTQQESEQHPPPTTKMQAAASAGSARNNNWKLHLLPPPRKKKAGTRVTEDRLVNVKQHVDVSGTGWSVIRKVLLGSACWCGTTRWRELESGDWRGMPPPPLPPDVGGGGWGVQESTVSPLWQRRILMGERCELPRFSGLILYDEKGLPICSNSPLSSEYRIRKGKPLAVVTNSTTLRDLL